MFNRAMHHIIFAGANQNLQIIIHHNAPKLTNSETNHLQQQLKLPPHFFPASWDNPNHHLTDDNKQSVEKSKLLNFDKTN
jgi:hypothetical protein